MIGKFIGTRIRVESSTSTAKYFPEYCLEEKSLFGRVKQNWYGVSDSSTHKFGEARRSVVMSTGYHYYSLEWAKAIIDTQAFLWEQYIQAKKHEETKETSYIKYP